MPRRPLTLHVSALSDAEYTSYTKSFAELAGPPHDTDWEKVVLSVREVRGWLRGRYGVGMDGTAIDEILRNFSPDLGPQDVLTGGQFFAVLRLVSHVRAGANVDESLVFLQPGSTPTFSAEASNTNVLKRSSWDVSSTGKVHLKPAAPPPPSRPSLEAIAAPPVPNGTPPAIPALPPRTASFQPISPGSNPFLRSPSTPHFFKPSESPTNPFRLSASTGIAPSSLSSTSSTTSSSPPKSAIPPLPPRKPVLLPPPRHASLNKGPSPPGTTSSKSSVYSTPSLPPPSAPPKPPKVTSPLIKQSLQAAKGAQSVKEVLDGLSRERRLEVIKKSGSGVSSHSGSPSPPGTTARRSPSPPRSFYDVAAAQVDRSSPTRWSSSADGHPEDRRTPPDVNISPATPSSPVHAPVLAATLSRSVFMPSQPSTGPFATSHNPRRTKSLHHPSPSTSVDTTISTSPVAHAPPIPPPRRRRPESVQVTNSPFADTENGIDETERRRPGSAPRHASFSISHPPSSGAPAPVSSPPSVIDALQRTFATLRPGSGFESARVRAEGRVLPSGYAKVGKEGERLVDDMDSREIGSVAEDVTPSPRENYQFRRRTSRDYRDGGVAFGRIEVPDDHERDELKVPVRPGEGWVAL